MNSARLARSVSGSRNAWRSSAPCSARIRRIACSSRSNSSDMPAWPASVSKSRRSALANPEVAPRRSPSSITPTSRVSPGTGATASCSVPSSSMNAAIAGVASLRRTIVACSSRTTVRSSSASSCAAGCIVWDSPTSRSDVRSGRSLDAPNRMMSAEPTLNASRVRPRRSTSARLDVRRPRQRPRHAVEELQRAMLRVLREIRPVGEHEHRGRREDEPARVPVLRDQRRAREPDATCSSARPRGPRRTSAASPSRAARPRRAR